MGTYDLERFLLFLFREMFLLPSQYCTTNSTSSLKRNIYVHMFMYINIQYSNYNVWFLAMNLNKAPDTHTVTVNTNVGT